jgi:TonB family protein
MGQARARRRGSDVGAGEYPTIGAYFSAAREAAGLAIEDLAARTHIKAAYLDAIELMRLDDLPSRPFAIGFVKTYAEALGVDAAAAVAKFKEDIGATSPADLVVEPVEPSAEAVEENSRPHLSLFAFGAVLVFILVCAVLITMPRGAKAPFKLDGPTTPIAKTPVARQKAAETPAPGAAPSAMPVLVEAARIEDAEPVYPIRCETEAAAVETVEIAFNVTAAGLVSGERVAATSNACFNDAALNAVRLWRFKPRTVDGAARASFDQRHVFEFKRPN